MPADSLVHGLLAQIADEDEAAVEDAVPRPSPFFAQLKDAGAPVRGKGG
jgi:hypothetical protein